MTNSPRIFDRLLAPDQLVEQFQGVFKEDVETYFKKAEAAIQEERQVFVKYYAKETIEKNPYQGGRRKCVV